MRPLITPGGLLTVLSLILRQGCTKIVAPPTNNETMTTMPVIVSASTFPTTTTTIPHSSIGPAFGICKPIADGCRLPNNSDVSLRPLCDLLQRDFALELKVSNDHIPPTYYHLNPCQGLNLNSNCSKNVTSCEEIHKSIYPRTIEYKNIGILPPRYKTYEGDVFLQFSTTKPFDKPRTTVICKCSSNKIRDPLLLYRDGHGQTEHEVVLQLNHVCCCADACANGYLPDIIDDSGYSTGTLMLILGSVALISYLVLGAIYNFRDGEHGIYLIPNVLFWKNTVQDVKLGLKYCLCLTKYTGNTGYDTLEGDATGGAFGEEIAVNYHNPNFDQRRPDYVKASKYSFDRSIGSTDSTTTAATAASGQTKGNEKSIETSDGASVEIAGEDEHGDQEEAINRVFSQGKQEGGGGGTYGAI